ncbi:hypothetical protein AC1031_002425 [Aphanomyces cochlioides]|nr:hypothetical protein AC1031_002425 [Aphanomyces cochlioides]
MSNVPEDDDGSFFEFNAPSYYDLLNDGEFEKSYVNNADGYFNQFHDGDWDNNEDDQRSNTDSAPDSLEDASQNVSSHSSSNGTRKNITHPVAPKLRSAKRAEAMKNARKPHTPLDADTIELQKKFHAMPIPISLDIAPNIAPNSTKPLTQPVMPKLATLARLGEKKPPTSKDSADGQNEKREHKPRSLPKKQVTQPVPFNLSKSNRTPTSATKPSPPKPSPPKPITFEVDRRAKAGEEFEARRQAALARENAAKAKAEEAREEARKQQTYKAKPYVRPPGFSVRPSTKELTTPTSPKLHTTRKLGPKKKPN